MSSSELRGWRTTIASAFLSPWRPAKHPGGVGVCGHSSSLGPGRLMISKGVRKQNDLGDLGFKWWSLSLTVQSPTRRVNMTLPSHAVVPMEWRLTRASNAHMAITPKASKAQLLVSGPQPYSQAQNMLLEVKAKALENKKLTHKDRTCFLGRNILWKFHLNSHGQTVLYHRPYWYL